MTTSRRISTDGSEWITFEFEGETVRCRRGESIAAALLANGIDAFGFASDGTPRAPFCNMGTCFECVLTVDEASLTRSCLREAEPGQDVRREERW